MTTTDRPDRPYHHLPDGRFRNPAGSPTREVTLGSFLNFLWRQTFKVKAPTVPDGHALSREETAAQFAAAGNPSVTWLGHAAFILRIGGKVILTDPFLGRNAGPLWLGPKRYLPAPMTAAELPRADLLLLSHNHYDHLDARTIEAYRFKEHSQVIVPLGVGDFFTRRGYRHVVEQDWWDSWSGDGVTVTTLPAVHFSARHLGDRRRTLWASFAIEAGGSRIWFSGDTAAGPVFTEIGRRAGPFDLAMIGIGAYEPRHIMVASHATPEEAIGIARAVGARRAIGMHWGSIMLTPEDPFEAPVRFRQAAVDQGFGADNAWILKVGETRPFGPAAG